MADDPRIALVEEGFAALNRSDPGPVFAMLHPDVRSHVSDQLVNSGRWHGIAGFGEMLGDWFEPWEELRFEVLEIESLDETHLLVTVRQNATGIGSGVPVTLDVVNVLGFTDGLLSRFEVHPDRQAALAMVDGDAS